MDDLDTALEYAYERKDGFIKHHYQIFELLESNVKSNLVSEKGDSINNWCRN